MTTSRVRLVIMGSSNSSISNSSISNNRLEDIMIRPRHRTTSILSIQIRRSNLRTNRPIRRMLTLRNSSSIRRSNDTIGIIIPDHRKLLSSMTMDTVGLLVVVAVLRHLNVGSTTPMMTIAIATEDHLLVRREGALAGTVDHLVA